jgi:hypothetical protein
MTAIHIKGIGRRRVDEIRAVTVSVPWQNTDGSRWSAQDATAYRIGPWWYIPVETSEYARMSVNGVRPYAGESYLAVGETLQAAIERANTWALAGEEEYA